MTSNMAHNAEFLRLRNQLEVASGVIPIDEPSVLSATDGLLALYKVAGPKLRTKIDNEIADFGIAIFDDGSDLIMAPDTIDEVWVATDAAMYIQYKMYAGERWPRKGVFC